MVKKIAFVIPFAFERFFQDSKQLWKKPEEFEDKIISQRNAWHFNWCKALRSAGMEVIIYHISRFGKELRIYKHQNGFNIVRVPTSFILYKSKNEISFHLLKQLKRDNPDAIFCVTHSMGAVIDMFDILVYWAKRNNKEIICRNPGADTYQSIYNTAIKKKQYLKKLISQNNIIKIPLAFLKYIYRTHRSNLKFHIKRMSFKTVKFIIPQTQIDNKQLQIIFKVPKDKLLEVPKPLDLSLFNRKDRRNAIRALGLKSNKCYLLHVSNLFNTKGCEYIIEALPDLLKEFPAIYLLVIGNGPKKTTLIDLAQALNVEKYVEFVGQVDHSKLSFYYNAANIFLLPTEIFTGEGQPNVILESIASGTPVITTNLPGPSSIMTSDFGLLVEPGNTQAIHNAIRILLNTKFKITSESRSRFIKDHSFKNVGTILLKAIN